MFCIMISTKNGYSNDDKNQREAYQFGIDSFKK